MTNPIFPEAKTHPTLALAAYLETLVRGRRVAVVGDAMLALPESLLDRGARLVHVYDPDPGRVAVATARRAADPTGSRAARPTTGLFSDELGVRDGAFEGVVITDLTLFEDPGEVIRRAKRLVSETGWVVVCSPNPAVNRTLFPASPDASRALGYYELYDTLSLVFPEVRMLGQAPFVGYAIVDFSEPEPDISIDTSALESAEVPEWYIIVASERRAHLEGHAIVGLPSSDLLTAPSDESVVRLEGANRELHDELAEEQKRASNAAALYESARASEERLRTTLAATELELEALRQAKSAEAEETERQAKRLSSLEGELSREKSLRSAAEGAHAQLEVFRGRVADLEAQILTLDPPTLRSKETQAARLALLDSQNAQLSQQVSDLTDRARRAEEALAQAQRAKSSLEESLRELRAQTSREQDAARTALKNAERQREELEARHKAEQQAEHQAELGRARTEVARLEKALKISTDALQARDQTLRETGEALAATELQLEAALARAKTPSAPDGSADLEEEIRRLEAALLSRGKDLAKAKDDLREAERIGKELLFEWQRRGPVSGPAGGNPGGSGSPTGEGSAGPNAQNRAGSAALAGFEAPKSARLVGPEPTRTEDEWALLAERASRAEADVLSLGWRATQLERELKKSFREADAPSARESRLSSALSAAQLELARKTNMNLPTDPTVTVEQSVLLEQVKAQAIRVPNP